MNNCHLTSPPRRWMREVLAHASHNLTVFRLSACIPAAKIWHILRKSNLFCTLHLFSLCSSVCRTELYACLHARTSGRFNNRKYPTGVTILFTSVLWANVRTKLVLSFLMLSSIYRLQWSLRRLNDVIFTAFYTCANVARESSLLPASESNP